MTDEVHPDDKPLLDAMAQIDQQLASGTLDETTARQISFKRLGLMNELIAVRKARKRNLTPPKT